MALRAPIICGYCQRLVAAGTRCTCRAVADRQRKAAYDATRPSASARGYGSKWRQARADYLAKHPVCARCDQPATIVDHVIPHRGDLKLFWDRKNWQPLCVAHHSGFKQSQEKRKQ